MVIASKAKQSPKSNGGLLRHFVPRNDAVILLCGPTAVGKTKLALELAKKHNGEIVSADSGQIYCELNIGTAKPTKPEQEAIPHHCIDIINPNEKYSAAAYSKLARSTIENIFSRNKTPFVVGGAGLYIHALFEGLSEAPGTDQETRNELDFIYKEKGIDYIFNQLEEVDPISAKKNEDKNPQRILRALEVYQSSGIPLSEWHMRKKEPFPYRVQKIGLSEDREILYERINKRVLEMFEAGWVEEVEAVIKKWGKDIPALKLVGYKEIVMHLDGELDFDQAITLIQQKTRNYAKRQLTWFRSDKEIQWLAQDKAQKIAF